MVTVSGYVDDQDDAPLKDNEKPPEPALQRQAVSDCRRDEPTHVTLLEPCWGLSDLHAVSAPPAPCQSLVSKKTVFARTSPVL